MASNENEYIDDCILNITNHSFRIINQGGNLNDVANLGKRKESNSEKNKKQNVRRFSCLPSISVKKGPKYTNLSLPEPPTYKKSQYTGRRHSIATAAPNISRINFEKKVSQTISTCNLLKLDGLDLTSSVIGGYNDYQLIDDKFPEKLLFINKTNNQSNVKQESITGFNPISDKFEESKNFCINPNLISKNESKRKKSVFYKTPFSPFNESLIKEDIEVSSYVIPPDHKIQFKKEESFEFNFFDKELLVGNKVTEEHNSAVVDENYFNMLTDYNSANENTFAINPLNILKYGLPCYLEDSISLLIWKVCFKIVMHIFYVFI